MIPQDLPCAEYPNARWGVRCGAAAGEPCRNPHGVAKSKVHHYRVKLHAMTMRLARCDECGAEAREPCRDDDDKIKAPCEGRQIVPRGTIP